MSSRQRATDASLVDDPRLSSTYRDVNGVRLHVVAAGDEDDPAVVLLHGYPEFWYCWREYVEPLVDAGYRVLLPDQRGYNLSGKPEGTRPYRISALSGDVADLIRSTGSDAAHVIGHDWGAAVAWDLALRRPEVVDRLGIVNVPHPTALRTELKSSPSQLRKSWYVFFFQLPRVPEWVQRRNDFRPLIDAMRTAEPGAFTRTDFERYRAAWRRPGALTAMINWYRAMFRHPDPPPRDLVTPPTLVLWGEQDSYLNPEMAPESVRYCPNGRLERFPEATHWIHHERPSEVADLFLDHLDG